MQNPRVVIKGFVSALDGITYEGQAVPVFSGTPTKAPNRPYIQIGSLSTVEEGTKDKFGHACSLDIQIIDNTRKNYTSPKATEAITQLVISALKPNLLSTVDVDEFDMINLLLTNTIQDPNIFETSNGYRNITQWSFDIYEALTGVWILQDGVWNDDGVWVDIATWNDAP